MIYRIKPSSKKHEKRQIKPYRRAGADSPRRLYGYRLDEIDLATLFELAKLEGAADAPRKKRKGGPSGKIKKIAQGVFAVLSRLFSALYNAGVWLLRRIKRFIDARRGKKEKPWVIPTLSGALVGVLVVSSISAFAVLYKLVISDYFGRYETVTVPSMVGAEYEAARAMLDTDSFNISVNFEYSSDIPYGTVMAQSPDGNVHRKIYAGGSLPTVSLVVSRGKQMLTMSDYIGKSARDARLELRNMGVSVTLTESYSDSVEIGKVISSTPQAGESFASDETVTLSVSLGKKKYYASVPNVIGLTENKAAALITAAGLRVGNISYRTSSSAAGTVLSQELDPYTSAEYGTALSLTVSAGEAFFEKKVPSLYGMTLDEAKERLSHYGLVCGNIYAVKSSEPSGTVVSQSPPPDSDISSSVVSVDIYVSS